PLVLANRPTTVLHPLFLHVALPIFMALLITPGAAAVQITSSPLKTVLWSVIFAEIAAVGGLILSLAPGLPVSEKMTDHSTVFSRSEEHTSELQSRFDLVCRLLLENK